MNILRKIINRINLYKEYILYIIKIKIPFYKKKIYIVNTVLHDNIGDSAIACAQISFLEKKFGDKYKIMEVPNNELYRYKHLLKKYILKKDDIITQIGGGNMGIEWFYEEKMRRDIIETFKDNKMIIFPQTIYYGDSEEGKKELENSRKVYNSHKDLTVVAREEVSYEIMKSVYDKCNVLLIPDIVLSMDEMEDKYERKYITFCFRDDPEKVIKDEEQKIIINKCKLISNDLFFNDMISKVKITKENRTQIVMDKFREFQKSKLVITDRLHGMIFCAVSKTPCIVFTNYNQKVIGTCKWLKDLKYIKYVSSAEEAINLIEPMLNIKNVTYDNSNYIKLYDQLNKLIK